MSTREKVRPVSRRRGYWYKRFITECPVCGRGDDYRERQYSERPEDPRDRVQYDQRYDWCDV